MLQEKKENKSPAFQFYARDFLTDMRVQLMSMEQRGIYITLLSYAWLEKGIPNDINVMKILCGNPKNFEQSIDGVLECFYEKDGKLYNRRMESIRLEQRERKKKASVAGKIGAQARWQPHSNRNAKAMRNDGSATATASTTASIRVPYKDIVSAFNENIGDKLHKVIKLNTPRKALIKRIWTENPNIEYFIAYYNKVSNIPFLLGENKNGWKADFDFIHKEKTVTKVHEGAYISRPIQQKSNGEYQVTPQDIMYVCPTHSEVTRKSGRNLHATCYKCRSKLVPKDEHDFNTNINKIMNQ